MQSKHKREKAKQRYYYGKTENEKSEEEKAYEENKEYMTYWQRLKYAFQYADNFQDIFDLSLSKAYAPARVTSAFLNIQSGPGRNYPVYLYCGTG